VLNSSGSGKVSSVLTALDWVLANRNTYNIRVVNMSLGAPAVDSYVYDPVCRAVRKLVDAGIVVVAAVGNNGLNQGGKRSMAGALARDRTVSDHCGASNTFGTDERKDDGVATYSSRGPTRSSYLDRRASGITIT
jgi:serine protease AprX